MYLGRKVFVLVSSIFLLLISGCNQATYRLRPEARETIKSTDVVLGISQQEINAGIEESQLAVTMGGGLIPALIDASVNNARSKKSEELMSSLRDELLEYDFCEVFKNEIEASMSDMSWLGLDNVTIDRQVPKKWVSNNLKISKASCVLFIESSYEFTPSLGQIKVMSKIFIIPNSGELLKYREKPKQSFKNPAKKGNTIYRVDEHIETINLDLKGVKKKDIISKCIENDAFLVKQALTTAANNIAVFIKNDLEKAKNEK